MTFIWPKVIQPESRIIFYFLQNNDCISELKIVTCRRGRKTTGSDNYLFDAIVASMMSHFSLV